VCPVSVFEGGTGTFQRIAAPQSPGTNFGQFGKITGSTNGSWIAIGDNLQLNNQGIVYMLPRNQSSSTYAITQNITDPSQPAEGVGAKLAWCLGDENHLVVLSTTGVYVLNYTDGEWGIEVVLHPSGSGGDVACGGTNPMNVFSSRPFGGGGKGGLFCWTKTNGIWNTTANEIYTPAGFTFSTAPEIQTCWTGKSVIFSVLSGSGTTQGGAFVFDLDESSGNWELFCAISARHTTDRWGDVTTMDLFCGTFAIGRPGRTSGAPDVGSIDVYKRVSTGCSLVQANITYGLFPSSTNFDALGFELQLSAGGRWLMAGAPSSYAGLGSNVLFHAVNASGGNYTAVSLLFGTVGNPAFVSGAQGSTGCSFLAPDLSVIAAGSPTEHVSGFTWGAAYTFNVVSYTGPTCATAEVSLCASMPCLNGGMCVPQFDGTYDCACPQGYTDLSCQTNINECTSAPCTNGLTCTDGVNSYICS